MATRLPHRKAQRAGIVLGLGLGGFVDGIVLHQLLQRHHMVSNWKSPMTFEEHRRSPTIMLLSLNLPQRDGREILQRVTAIQQGATCAPWSSPAPTTPRTGRETLALGVDAYFVQPYHVNELMQLGGLIKHLAFGNPPLFMQHTQCSPHSRAGMERYAFPWRGIALALQSLDRNRQCGFSAAPCRRPRHAKVVCGPRPGCVVGTADGGIARDQ